MEHIDDYDLFDEDFDAFVQKGIENFEFDDDTCGPRVPGEVLRD